MKHIRNTRSLCPTCLKSLPTEVVEENNKVYFLKNCPVHGPFKVLIEKDAYFYKQVEFNIIEKHKESTTNVLVSSLVMPITDSCNMKCRFCFHPNNKNENLSINEILKISESFPGVLCLSGGEPTLHPDLLEIIKRLTDKSIKVKLVTNGIKLSDITYVEELYKAGLRMILFSLNAFSNKILEKIDGSPVFEEKIKALENVNKFDIEVEFSMSLLRYVNETELKKAIVYCLSSDKIGGLRIRSFSRIGRCPDDYEGLVLSEMVQLLAESLGVKMSHLTRGLSKRTVSSILNFNAYLFFYKNDHIHEFLFSTDIYADISFQGLKQKIKWAIEILRIRGIKIFLKIIFLHLRKKGQIKKLYINMWSWPDKYSYELRQPNIYGVYHLDSGKNPDYFFRVLLGL